MTISRLGLATTMVMALSGATTGCALFTKADPVVLRYFTPEALGGPPRDIALVKAPAGTPLELRLGRVTAASYLKDRIAFRDQGFEIGYYDRLRWTERPEDLLRRALGRALFEDEGIRQIVSGAGPILDVDLGAFEELKAPRHVARITVTWVLRDDQHVQLQQTFTIERAVASGEAAGHAALAPAMAAAFDEAVQRVVARTKTALANNANTTNGTSVTAVRP